MKLVEARQYWSGQNDRYIAVAGHKKSEYVPQSILAFIAKFVTISVFTKNFFKAKCKANAILWRWHLYHHEWEPFEELHFLLVENKYLFIYRLGHTVV
jgi:hypothetical protein